MQVCFSLPLSLEESLCGRKPVSVVLFLQIMLQDPDTRGEAAKQQDLQPSCIHQVLQPLSSMCFSWRGQKDLNAMFYLSRIHIMIRLFLILHISVPSHSHALLSIKHQLPR